MPPEQAVVESGALDALVGCLEEFDPGVKEAAAWALGYIARHNGELAQTVRPCTLSNFPWRLRPLATPLHARTQRLCCVAECLINDRELCALFTEGVRLCSGGRCGRSAAPRAMHPGA